MRESVTYQSIKQEGREEGIELGVRLVAVNLLHEGIPVELVAKTTGLTVEQVQQLQLESQTALFENQAE